MLENTLIPVPMYPDPEGYVLTQDRREANLVAFPTFYVALGLEADFIRAGVPKCGYFRRVNKPTETPQA